MIGWTVEHLDIGGELEQNCKSKQKKNQWPCNGEITTDVAFPTSHFRLARSAEMLSDNDNDNDGSVLGASLRFRG